MNKNIPFQTIDWASIPRTEYKGESGTAYWQTAQYQGLRIRIVEYSKGYMADHWCQKGHIVHCLEGEFESELQDGRKFTLSRGSTYVVSDGLSSHRSYTKDGVKVLIIDGNFLENQVELKK
jgi:quercetin dioxygenase-like cupin family protein